MEGLGPHSKMYRLRWSFLTNEVVNQHHWSVTENGEHLQFGVVEPRKFIRSSRRPADGQVAEGDWQRSRELDSRASGSQARPARLDHSAARRRVGTRASWRVRSGERH